MKTLRFLLLLCLCSGASAIAQRVTIADALKAAVIRADETRIYALLAPDAAALDDMLTPDCVYVHSDGVVHTKTQFLQAIRTGALKYLNLRYTAAPTVRLYGSEAAVLNAPSQLEIQLGDGKPVKLSLQTTAVYVLLHERWQLASYQSTNAPAQK